MTNKIGLLMLVLSLAISGLYTPVSHGASQQGYTYSYWGEAVPAPAAYVPGRVIDGNSLGIGAFNSPVDLFVDEKNQIYVLDSGNHRIIIMNAAWELFALSIHSSATGCKTNSAIRKEYSLPGMALFM